jgi:hypothetical protein
LERKKKEHDLHRGKKTLWGKKNGIEDSERGKRLSVGKERK